MSCWTTETEETGNEASASTSIATGAGTAAPTVQNTDSDHCEHGKNVNVDSTSTTVPRKRRARSTHKSRMKKMKEIVKTIPMFGNGNLIRRRPRRKPAIVRAQQPQRNISLNKQLTKEIQQMPSSDLHERVLDPRLDRLARKKAAKRRRRAKRAAQKAKELEVEKVVGDRDGKPGLVTMFNKTMQPSALFRDEDGMEGVVEASDEGDSGYEDIPMDE